MGVGYEGVQTMIHKISYRIYMVQHREYSQYFIITINGV